MKKILLIFTILLIPTIAIAQTAEEYYEKGNIKYKNGDYKEALEDYNSAIELNPNYSEAYIERARTKVFGLDDYRSALSDLDTVIKLDPKNISSYTLRATINEVVIGNLGAALNDLSKAIGLDPENPDLYASRGILREDMSDHIGALEDYNKVIELDPKDSYSYSYRGSLKENISDYIGAIEDYNKALELDSEHAEAYRGRAIVKTELNDYQGALQDYNKSIEIWPDYTISYIERGIVKNELGYYESAIQDFNKAIEISPKNSSAFVQRGTTKFKLGYYLGAVQDYSKAMILKTIDSLEAQLFMIKYTWDYGLWSELFEIIVRGVGALIILIIFFVILILLLFYIVRIPFKLIGVSTSTSAVYNYSSTETKTAKRAMTWDNIKFIESNSDNTYVYFNSGQAKLDQGNYKEAIKDFDKSIEFYRKAELSPYFSKSYNLRGAAKVCLEDYGGAIQDYSKAIELDPNYHWAYNNRGNAKAGLGDYKGAIQDYEKAIQLNPVFPESYENKGNAKVKLKDYRGAIQDYSKAIEQNPNNLWAYAMRGHAKYESKDYRGAIQDYSKAISLDTSDAEAYTTSGAFKTDLNFNYEWAYTSRGVAKYLLGDYKGAMQDYEKAIKINPDYTIAYKNRDIINQNIQKKVNQDNVPIREFYNFYAITESGNEIGPLTLDELIKRLGFINRNSSVLSSLGNSIQMMWNEHKGNKFLANKDLIIYNKYLPNNYINKVLGYYKGQKKIWSILDFISKNETKEHLFPHLQRAAESEEQWLYRCESEHRYLNRIDSVRGDFYFKKFISEFGSDKYERHKKEQQELARKKEKKAIERLERKDYWKRQKGVKLELAVTRLLEKAYPDSKIKLTKQSSDGGVDLFVQHNNDELWAIQCKGHKKPIGRPDCQKIVGAALQHNAKAIMISISGYSPEAKRYANSNNVNLQLWTTTDLINIAEEINF